MQGVAEAQVDLLEAGDVGARAHDGEARQQGEADQKQAVAAGGTEHVARGGRQGAEQEQRQHHDEHAADPAAVLVEADERDEREPGFPHKDLEVELLVEASPNSPTAKTHPAGGSGVDCASLSVSRNFTCVRRGRGRCGRQDSRGS